MDSSLIMNWIRTIYWVDLTLSIRLSNLRYADVIGYIDIFWSNIDWIGILSRSLYNPCNTLFWKVVKWTRGGWRVANGGLWLTIKFLLIYSLNGAETKNCKVTFTSWANMLLREWKSRVVKKLNSVGDALNKVNLIIFFQLFLCFILQRLSSKGKSATNLISYHI